ncbi:transmembrane protein, putative [Medicago truncatula]|uniref:Transmembrane protein, putative n=1 Tax=Medicago truncatula TaxID=3880 RepID=G7K8N8_MEDTR|nr:transmembrane protein, putative [Medicago truncatula]
MYPRVSNFGIPSHESPWLPLILFASIVVVAIAVILILAYGPTFLKWLRSPPKPPRAAVAPLPLTELTSCRHYRRSKIESNEDTIQGYIDTIWDNLLLTLFHSALNILNGPSALPWSLVNVTYNNCEGFVSFLDEDHKV